MEAYVRHGSLVESLEGPRVFAHDIGTLRGFGDIMHQVSGIRKYDRATAIARPEDVVFLKSTPDKAYLQWLGDVGLGSKNIVVISGREDMSLPERIMKNGSKNTLDQLLGSSRNGAVFCPYYGGRLEKRTSDYLGLFMYSHTELAEELDNKIGFKLTCRKLGIPVVKESIIDTYMTESEMARLIEHRLEKTGKVILRGEYGASASTIHILDHVDISFLQGLRNRYPSRDRFLVEPFFDTLSSPSSVW
ncbi:MAG: hypothetical protein ACXABH_14885, partial [Candidatus Thorarchaeota archaeon]